ncbi:helicase C-terminal domain-containing protein [Herbidospora yilanensis]|uniref:helicase C-terminal domain-containing protein n=1 Tax=Herbidospora yilanensis TaxID=354426 RepID=UPI00078400F8|nr:helicase C-terminal domain-containing protein [Herbidospora yilanensis]
MSEGFTEWLRSRSDEQLRVLAMSRPELITPVPANVPGLAARAGTPSAVGRALDRLDGFTLAVAETLVVFPPDELPAAIHRATQDAPGTDEAIGRALATLTEMALIDGERRLAPGVQEALDPPAGLGQPAARVFRHDERAITLADPRAVRELIAQVGPQARAALDELAWGPSSGRVPNARREVSVETAQSPIEQLLARGLLGAIGDDTVTLPREVGLVLRDDRLHRDLSPAAPPLEGATRRADLAARTAAGQAFTFVRSVEELCEIWSVDPPGVLRTGGLAIRDLRRAAQQLDVPEWTAALVIEVAHAAGLVATGGPADAEWLPTLSYDLWRARQTEDRWEAVARAWLTLDRVPGLAGGRDDRDRLLNVLHPDLRRGAAAEIRRRVLTVVAATELAPSQESVLARLTWERPRRRGAHLARLAEFALREAEVMGLTGLGVMSPHGRAVLTGVKAADLLAPLLPEPVDHVVLQADLTAVAPGPLTGELDRWLGLAADVESKGGATVYRFAEASIRRVLDAGQSAEEILAMLARHSTTPVPQPLTYLVTDVARRHGRLRVGSASSYLRCDDPAVLDELLADRRAGVLRMRRLAPTVLVSKASRATMLDSLRSMGYAPVAESLEGDVLITRADARRTEAQPVRQVNGLLAPEAEVVTAAIRALRAGDHALLSRPVPASQPGGAVPRTPATATISALQEAIKQGSRVWIGYLDSQGQATSRILEPARIEGGYLTAYDETRAAIHRFVLHRITGVADVN